jgi:PAS domain S-box-containing protein
MRIDEKSRSEPAPEALSSAMPWSTGDPPALEQWLDSIVERLPDATFAIDQDKRVVAWNRACERLTGVKKEALLGRGDYACAEPFFGEKRPTLIDLLETQSAEVEALYEYVQREADGVYAEAFNLRVRGGRGAQLWFGAFHLFDRQGRRCGAVEVIRDVTDQKRSRDRLLKVQRVAHVGFLEWDLKTNEVFLSDEASELTGLGGPQGRISTPELVARTVHPDDLARAGENLDLAIQGIRPYDDVHRHLRPDGTIKWVHARGELSRDSSGAPARLFGTIVDITEEKLVEQALRENELTYRTLFESAGDATRGEAFAQAIVRDRTQRQAMEDALRRSETQLSLVLNNVSDVIFAIAVEPGESLRFASVNRRFLEATGLTESQVVGARVTDVIPEPAHELVFGKYREAIRSGQPVHWEEVTKYPSGVKIGHVTVVPVYDVSGACTQLVGLVHDVTERKQAEEQVRQLNEDLKRHTDTLELRVQARTEQLAARNQELKSFAYTVSHDLKAPLRGIAGYANELDRKHRGGLSERAHFCLTQILSATANLDRLIEDLLHYSRLDAETPSLTEVDLQSLVNAILRDRDLVITELNMEVTVDIAFATVRAWERGLMQILTNLVDNAIKFSRKASPPRLHIAAAVLDGAWRLTVSDNGIGFDMKYHDRIFGLFNRLVRTEEYEGTGAGLAIVRKVLDKQGGHIRAEAALGRGATFFVEIPRPRDPD